MDSQVWKVVLLAMAFALAGCADDGEDGEDGDGNGGTGTSTPGPGNQTTTTTTTGMTGGGQQEQYVNGTVSGVADCSLVAGGAPAAGGSSGDVPAGMQNGTYELMAVEPSGTESVCIYFDDGTTGNSGTVPGAATSFMVYADGAPAGVAYAVKFNAPAGST